MTRQLVEIGQLGKVITGDTPPKKNPEYYGSAYPFIKPTDMQIGQRYTYAYEECYSEGAYEKYRKKLIPEGATAVVTIGSIGQKLTLTHTPCFVNQAVNAVIPNNEKFNSLYVFYLLKHNLNLVKSADTGASSGRENVSKSNFSKLQVLATLDIKEQERIACILDGYDSLIENNQRRIALLEESARLLYREWFVNLRFRGFESVPLTRGVPEGWCKTSIAEQTTFLNRGITPAYNDSAPGLVINQKCIRQGRLSMSPARRQSKEVKPERLIQKGDVLINSTGAGTLGRVAQVRSPVENCTVDTHVTIARPIGKEWATYFGQALISLEPTLSGMGKGATNQLELSRNDIGAIEIWHPPVAVARDFHELVWPMLEHAEILLTANQKLVEARDELLPKLMSGEIQV